MHRSTPQLSPFRPRAKMELRKDTEGRLGVSLSKALPKAAVNAAVAACPNLIDIALLGCECAGEAAISHPLL